MDQGNYRQKRRPIRVKCGKRSKRCFPMSERRGLLICSSTVDSSHEKSSVFVPRNGVMYVKSIALNALSWSVYFVMPISCAGSWGRISVHDDQDSASAPHTVPQTASPHPYSSCPYLGHRTSD